MNLTNPPSKMLGDKLRGRRLAMGKSMPEVADALGVHRNSIARWERDCIAPYDVLVRWATFLRTTINVVGP